MSVSPVTLAKLTGTRMVPHMSVMGAWTAGDWDYAELRASALDMYEAYEMSGSHESVSFRTYLGMLTDLVTPGASDMSGCDLLRAHCTAMRIMFADMIARIDRECAELSELLQAISWESDIQDEEVFYCKGRVCDNSLCEADHVSSYDK